MQSFEFKMPTEIIFGRHAEDRVAEKLRAYGASRVYIVSVSYTHLTLPTT